MKKPRDSVYAIIAAFTVVTAACQPADGPGERAGRDVDRAAKKVGDQVDKAADRIKNKADDPVSR